MICSPLAHFGDSSLDTSHLLEDAKDHFEDSMSRSKSESWHERVYGGLVDATTLMAAEIGAAAGFEAWRRYSDRRGHEASSDRERQMRSLVDIAVREGQSLPWCKRILTYSV
jgi:hypothetical protein